MGDDNTVPAADAAVAPVPVPTPTPQEGAAYPAIPAAPPGYVPWSPPQGPRPRSRRIIPLAVAGWLIIAVGTATGVALTGPGGTAQAAATGPHARVPATVAPTTAVPLPVPTQTATAAPSPTSTVKGTVRGATHSGDLRFFLLPVPSDAEAYGAVDGSRMTLSDVAETLDNSSTSKRILNEYGCSGGAYREYRNNDGSLTVHTQLIHFNSSGHAGGWASGLTFTKGSSFSVSGVSNAKGRAFDPSNSEGTGELLGISHVGDVEYEIEVTGTGKLPHSLLAPLMKREEQRLGGGH